MYIVYHMNREEFGVLRGLSDGNEVPVCFGSETLNVSENQLKVLEVEKFFDFVNSMNKNHKLLVNEE